MKLKNIIGHFNTINMHRWRVFKFSIIAGIPFRGLKHDLSKYSPIEFFESARYYQNGRKSPIPVARKEIGYSKAWLHHQAKNKHHFEYWYDTEIKYAPVMPFKYSVELICDMFAAGITYLGKEWTIDKQLEYWNTHKEHNNIINPKMKLFCKAVFMEAGKVGINKAIRKKNLKRIYDRYCN